MTTLAKALNIFFNKELDAFVLVNNERLKGGLLLIIFIIYSACFFGMLIIPNLEGYLFYVFDLLMLFIIFFSKKRLAIYLVFAIVILDNAYDIFIEFTIEKLLFFLIFILAVLLRELTSLKNRKSNCHSKEIQLSK